MLPDLIVGDNARIVEQERNTQLQFPAGRSGLFCVLNCLVPQPCLRRRKNAWAPLCPGSEVGHDGGTEKVARAVSAEVLDEGLRSKDEGRHCTKSRGHLDTCLISASRNRSRKPGTVRHRTSEESVISAMDSPPISTRQTTPIYRWEQSATRAERPGYQMKSIKVKKVSINLDKWICVRVSILNRLIDDLVW